jgi:hypothetical protein
MVNSKLKTMEEKHKYVHKETIRERISYGRSESRCETFRQTDVYFCKECLEEKTVVKEWCGQLHYSSCPDWVRTGTFKPGTIW